MKAYSQFIEVRKPFDNSPLSGRKPRLNRRGIAPRQNLFHGKLWKNIGATEPEMLKALKEIYSLEGKEN